MHKNWITLFILFYLSSQSSAHESTNRTGLLASFGLGYHNSKIDNNLIDGLATTFRLGYGLSPHVALYYSNSASWYVHNNSSYSLSITGLGGAYYLDDGIDSLYFHGAYGWNSLTNWSSLGVPTKEGLAYSLGLGYVLSHWQFELNYIGGNLLNDSNEIAYISKTNSIRFGINYLWYWSK